MAQERDEDQHRQESADQDGIPHVPHGVTHELGEVVHHLEPNTRWQRGPVLLEGRPCPVRDLKDVAADLSRHVEERGRLAVPADEGRPVDDSLAHLGQVAEVERRPLAEGHHHPPDVLDARQLARRQHLVLEVVLREATHRDDLVRRPQRVAHLLEGHPGGVQPVRVHDDRDLPLLAREHLDVGHTAHAAEERPQLVDGEVAQVGGRQRSGHVDAEDREERGRHPLHHQLGAGRQLGLHLVGLRLHELQRVRHVSVGVEDDRDLAGASDRLGADPSNPENRACRLLERTGHGQLHHPRREIPRVRHHHDARELHLGVDVAGQRGHRVEARGREKDDAEQDHPAVPRGEARDVHGFFASFARSPRPWIPETRTVCPSTTPETTSTASGVSRPSVTFVRVASSPVTT
jgi:hypothetical protein